MCLYLAYLRAYAKHQDHKEERLETKRIEHFHASFKIDSTSFWSTKIAYQNHRIPKRTGGTRTLKIPQPALKELQKKLLPNLEKSLKKKIHKSAHAYVKGRSIKTNASQHVGEKVIIKLDIKNFFDSVTPDHLRPHFAKVSPSIEIQNRLIELLITEGGLPQGAPTSPLLANIVMYKFDVALLGYCVLRNYKYTRYADDMTVSIPDDNPKAVRRVIKFVEENLSASGFALNKKPHKLNVLRPHQAQRICGVTINSGKPTISRKQRRKLRAARHYKETGKNPSWTSSQLQGHEAYVEMIMRDEIDHKQCYWCYHQIAFDKVLTCEKCGFVSRGKTLAGIKRHWKSNHRETFWVFKNICEKHRSGFADAPLEAQKRCT